MSDTDNPIVQEQPVKVAEFLGPKTEVLTAPVEQLPIDTVLRMTEEFGDFIVNRPDFSDQKINEFIIQTAVTKEKFDDVVNKFIGGGYKYIKQLQNVSPEQIEKGMKVEMEHINPTDQYARAKSLRITIDHLKEDEKYYDKLEKVEGIKGASVEVKEASVNASIYDAPIRWMASLNNVEKELSPSTQKPSFKATWEKNDETLPFEAVVIDTTPNANKWQIDQDELVNLAMHIGEVSLHVNHAKNDAHKVIGKFMSGKVDGNKLIARAIILDRDIAKSVFYGTLHDVSMSGRPKKAVCSGCGESTLHAPCKACKGSFEKVSGMKWDEGSIVTDGAYESAKILGVLDTLDFSASMNRWVASKNAVEERGWADRIVALEARKAETEYSDKLKDMEAKFEARCAEMEKKLEALCAPKKADDEKKDEKEDKKEDKKEEVKEEIKDEKKDEKKEAETVPVLPPNPEVNKGGEITEVHVSSVMPPVEAAKEPQEPIKEAAKAPEMVVDAAIVDTPAPVKRARMDDDIEAQKAKNRGAGRVADPNEKMNANNSPMSYQSAHDLSVKTHRQVQYAIG